MTIFARNNGFFLLINKIPILVLLDYQILKLLIFYLILLQGLSRYFDLLSKVFSSFFRLIEVLLQNIQLIFQVILRFDLLVQSDDDGLEVIHFDVPLVHG